MEDHEEPLPIDLTQDAQLCQSNSEKPNQKPGDRLKPWHFQKGQSGNPGGIGRQVTLYKMLKEAIAKVGKEKGESILESIVRRAYTNDKMAIALLQTIAPEFSRASNKANKDHQDPLFPGGLKIITIREQNNYVNGDGTAGNPGADRPFIG
jgi:hypothetical protein